MSSDTAAAARATDGQQATNRRRSRRRSSSTREQRIALAAVLGIGIGIALTLCDTAPTGHAAVDGVYRALIMAATILAGARARRRVLLVAAALVSVGSDGWMLVPAAAALVLSFILAWTDRRHRVAGGIAGALIGWAALDLSWPASPIGATTVLAAVALLPLWFSGYRVARRGTRRTIEIAAMVVVAVVVLGSAVGLLVALTQRSTLQTAAEGTMTAATSLTGGGDEESTTAFRSSADQFRSAANAAGSWWAAPAMLVPVVAQNVEALRSAAAAGADLNDVAAELSESVDYDALSRPDGSVDVVLLASYAGPAQRAADAVGTATSSLSAAQSPWLVPPVADQLDTFVAHLDDAAGATDLAAAATQDLPAILGADGPRRYLMLLGSPSEARDLGGHLGNWAELTAVDGRLDVARVGDAYDLFTPTSPTRPTLSADADIPESLREVEPTRFPQNWGSSPDLATVGRLAADLYPQTEAGSPIDGVLYADPTAFAALLQFTGPVQSDGVTLSADNAVSYLTREQYLREDGQTPSITPLIRTALEQFTSSAKPTPSRLADVFGPVVSAGHLQFATTSGTDAGLLAVSGLDQPIATPRGGDLLAVINRNANPSKIDAYLHRTIDYRLRWDPVTGRTAARVVITLRNDAPAAGLPPLVTGSAVATPPGTNRTELSVLSPFDAVGAMVDGSSRGLGSRDDIDGLHRYSLTVDLAPGQTRTVIIDLDGDVDPGPLYRLSWYNQPLPNADQSRVVVEPPDGGASAVTKVGTARVEHLTLGEPR